MQCRCVKRTFFVVLMLIIPHYLLTISYFWENNLFINVSCTKSFQNLLYKNPSHFEKWEATLSSFDAMINSILIKSLILMILSKLSLSLHQRKIKLPPTSQNEMGFYKLVAFLHLSTFLFDGVPLATCVETTRWWLNGKLLNGGVCTRSINRVS